MRFQASSPARHYACFKSSYRFAALCIAALAALLPQSASAITYDVNISSGQSSVVGQISTGDALGVLDDPNITTYSLEITNANGTNTLNNGNSIFQVSGNDFTATASGLFYNFGSMSSSYIYITGAQVLCFNNSAGACSGSTGLHSVVL